MSGLKAGRLRRLVTIERPLEFQDASGASSVQWGVFADKVPAEIAPLSTKEFLAAQQMQSQVMARITIRHRAGLDASMRIRHGCTIYNIAGVIPDNETGLKWLTLPVSVGVNAG